MNPPAGQKSKNLPKKKGYPSYHRKSIIQWETFHVDTETFHLYATTIFWEIVEILIFGKLITTIHLKNSSATMKMGFLLVLVLSVFGLEAYGQSLGFVRVFDPNGEIIAKGNFVAATDHSLRLERNGTVSEWPVSQIGVIKTKRSGGNNVALGGAIGVMAMTFAAVIIPDNGAIFGDGGSTAVINGAISGVIYGTAIGAITILAKNSTLFYIGGNGENLKPLEMYLRAQKL